MLGEVRNGMLLQRVLKGADALDVKDAMTMATRNGAKLLGYREAGKLEQGWLADIAAFDVHTLGYAGSLSDPLAALLSAVFPSERLYDRETDGSLSTKEDSRE